MPALPSVAQRRADVPCEASLALLDVNRLAAPGLAQPRQILSFSKLFNSFENAAEKLFVIGISPFEAQQFSLTPL